MLSYALIHFFFDFDLLNLFLSHEAPNASKRIFRRLEEYSLGGHPALFTAGDEGSENVTVGFGFHFGLELDFLKFEQPLALLVHFVNTTRYVFMCVRLYCLTVLPQPQIRQHPLLRLLPQIKHLRILRCHWLNILNIPRYIEQLVNFI